MSKLLVTHKLSNNRFLTPEGYLIIKNCILSKVGSQEYRRNEVFSCDSDEIISVNRTEEEVFNENSLASFIGKPITIEHPDVDVNPENHNQLSVGHIIQVRKGELPDGTKVVQGDVMITEQEAIDIIESGEMTDLSVGYDCDINDDENPQQRNIRVNHLALCEEGRAGCARLADSKKNKTKDSNILANVYNMSGKLLETKKFSSRRELDNYANSLKLYDMTSEKEVYKNKNGDLAMQEIYKIVVSDSKTKDGKWEVGKRVKYEGEWYYIINYSKGTWILENENDGSQIRLSDSVKDSDIENLKKRLARIAKKYNYNRDEAIAEANTMTRDDEQVAELVDYVMEELYVNENLIRDSYEDIKKEIAQLERLADYYDDHNNPQKAIEVKEEIEELKKKYKIQDADFDIYELRKMRVETYKGTDIYKIDGKYSTNPNTTSKRFNSIEEVKKEIDSRFKDSIKDSDYSELRRAIKKWAYTDGKTSDEIFNLIKKYFSNTSLQERQLAYEEATGTKFAEKMFDSKNRDSLTREEMELVDYVIENLDHHDNAEEAIKLMRIYYSEYQRLAYRKPEEVKEYFNEHINDSCKDSIKIFNKGEEIEFVDGFGRHSKGKVLEDNGYSTVLIKPYDTRYYGDIVKVQRYDIVEGYSLKDSINLTKLTKIVKIVKAVKDNKRR